MGVVVRDLSGRPLFVLDGETLRDVNAKVLARKSGDDAQTRKLSANAAAWMSGRQVLMDLAPGDVATAATQADFGIPVNDCIADQVSRVRLIKHDRGVFYVESAADAVTLVVGGVGRSQPAEFHPAFTPTTFTTTPYALTARLPKRLLANADFNLKARTLRRLVEALRLLREQRVATLLTTSTTWAAGNRVTAVAKWNGGVSPNPITDLFAALKASYLPANTLVLPESALPFFYASNVRDYVQAGGQLPRVIVAASQYLSGGTGAAVYAWAPATTVNVALLRCPADDLSIPSSLTFRFLGEDGAQGETTEGILVREFEEPTTDSVWLVCAHNDYEALPSNQVGAVITGALA